MRIRSGFVELAAGFMAVVHFGIARRVLIWRVSWAFKQVFLKPSMEFSVQSSPVRVRYCMRSIFSPLLLAGCLAELSGSFPAAGAILLAGAILTVLIIVRPYMEITDGGARHVGLLTGKRTPVEDLGEILSSRTLRWFMRKSDLEQVRHLHAGMVSKRAVPMDSDTLRA